MGAAAVPQSSAPVPGAEAYVALGWSPIPLRADKRPWVPWEAYQRRRAAPEEIEAWRRRFRPLNVGIVTGAISGLVVLDSDGERGDASLAGKHLPPTPTVRTGKGIHRYYRHPGHPVPNAVGLLPGVDLRGDGGYVVAPPSMHPSGRRYEWVQGLSPWDLPPAPMPEWLRQALRPPDLRPPRPPEWWRRFVADGAVEGTRNNSVARLAGHLLRRGVDPFVVLELCLAWNQARCRPPLDAEEVACVVNSIAGRERRRRAGCGAR